MRLASDNWRLIGASHLCRTGSVCWLGALRNWDLRLPPHVLPIPGNVLAPHPHHDPVPQQRLNLSVVGALDHRDPAAEHRHAVALRQGSVPLASVVILRAFRLHRRFGKDSD